MAGAQSARFAEPGLRYPRLYSMVTNTAARLAAGVALCVMLAGATLAQTSPLPGPTVPPDTLPVPNGGESLGINPTKGECNARWRRDLRWTREEFENACAQLEVRR
jgi:hypothetical protein